MKNRKKYTEKEWQEIASLLSEENKYQNDLLTQFMSDDDQNTAKQWNEIRDMTSKKEINVDQAWDKVKAKVNDSEIQNPKSPAGIKHLRTTIIKIAAVALIILGIGSAALYLNNSDYLSRNISAVTGNDEKNLQVSLPDGSIIYLNRNTELSYKSNFGKNSRNVSLTGEAYFEITPDASKPFSIDAGNANVTVLGTTFNVITKNELEEVEVYVKTGKVMVSSPDMSQSILLDPEFIGTMDQKAFNKTTNNNPNYLSWNTGYLDYDGQKLKVVFHDLKRVYNMEIIADDPDILELPWTSPIDNQAQDTIIRLICGSFNLSYVKDGGVYHLSEK